MTNEEVVRLFLKKHRKYSMFKRCRSNDTSRYKNIKVTEVGQAINEAFDWFNTETDVNTWDELHYSLIDMCRDLNLSGEVEIDKI